MISMLGKEQKFQFIVKEDYMRPKQLDNTSRIGLR